MSYRNLILADSASSYYSLDSSSPANMVNGNLATVVGTSTSVFPVVSREIASMKLNYPDSLIIEGESICNNAQKSFTQEIWVRSTVKNVALSYYAYLFYSDFMFITLMGSAINVQIGFNAGDVSLSVPRPTDISIMHIVLVYNVTEIKLYINGILEGFVEVTEEYFQSGFLTSTDEFSFENITSGKSFEFGSIALYKEPLSEFNITNHYRVGTSYNNPTDFASNNPFLSYIYDDDHVRVIQSESIDALSGIQEGTLIFQDGVIFSDLNSDTLLTETSTYTHRFALDEYVGIAGSKLDWIDIGGVTVTTSVDNGETWDSYTRGNPVTGLEYLDDIGEDKYLLVEIEFASGIAYQTYIENLTLVVYATKYVEINEDDAGDSTNPDDLFYNKSVQNILSLDNNSGLEFLSNVSSVIIPNVSDFGAVKTVELIFKTNASTAFNPIILTGTGISVSYNNTTGVVSTSGVSKYFVNFVESGTVKFNTWNHIVIHFTTATSNEIELGNDATHTLSPYMNLLYAKVFSSEVSDDEIDNMKTFYFGSAPYRVTPTNSLEVSSPNVTYIAAKWS